MSKRKTILLSLISAITILLAAVIVLLKQSPSIRARLRTEYPINLEY